MLEIALLTVVATFATPVLAVYFMMFILLFDLFAWKKTYILKDFSLKAILLRKTQVLQISAVSTFVFVFLLVVGLSAGLAFLVGAACFAAYQLVRWFMEVSATPETLYNE